MIIDNHVHVGWFRDGYHNPSDIWNDVQRAGVDEICVSSTSSCAELYDLVIEEMLELKSLACEKIHPILWVTPKMLSGGHISQMLSAPFVWEGVKMHPKAHPEWGEDRSMATKAAKLANALNVPMLIHTDEDYIANAGTYEFLYDAYPQQLFVLAHGKPMGQVLRLLHKYQNVIVDTAFMNIENIERIVNEGFSNRIVFGTDVPINKLFFKKATPSYIRGCIADIQKRLSPDIAKLILGTTFYRKTIVDATLQLGGDFMTCGGGKPL